jgi:hypothetical protein
VEEERSFCCIKEAMWMSSCYLIVSGGGCQDGDICHLCFGTEVMCASLGGIVLKELVKCAKKK